MALKCLFRTIESADIFFGHSQLISSIKFSSKTLKMALKCYLAINESVSIFAEPCHVISSTKFHQKIWWNLTNVIIQSFKRAVMLVGHSRIIFQLNFHLKVSQTVHSIEMKGITRCKLTIISESAACKKFLGQIVSYPASL